MTNEQRKMIEYTMQEVVWYLIEDKDITMEQAMEEFFLSDVFDKLNDIETGLYLEGSAYIYEMLKREFALCEKKTADNKSILAEIQEMFHDDKGWDNEESMIADMAAFRKERMGL